MVGRWGRGTRRAHRRSLGFARDDNKERAAVRRGPLLKERVVLWQEDTLSFSNRPFPMTTLSLFVIPSEARDLRFSSDYSPVKGLVSLGLAVVGSGAFAVSAASRAGPGPPSTR